MPFGKKYIADVMFNYASALRHYSANYCPKITVKKVDCALIMNDIGGRSI